MASQTNFLNLFLIKSTIRFTWSQISKAMAGVEKAFLKRHRRIYLYQVYNFLINESNSAFLNIPFKISFYCQLNYSFQPLTKGPFIGIMNGIRGGSAHRFLALFFYHKMCLVRKRAAVLQILQKVIALYLKWTTYVQFQMFFSHLGHLYICLISVIPPNSLWLFSNDEEKYCHIRKRSVFQLVSCLEDLKCFLTVSKFLIKIGVIYCNSRLVITEFPIAYPSHQHEFELVICHFLWKMGNRVYPSHLWAKGRNMWQKKANKVILYFINYKFSTGDRPLDCKCVIWSSHFSDFFFSFALWSTGT